MTGIASGLSRVGIVGATSLRGKEITALLDERQFASREIRLLDDDSAGGTLTEAGGEPTFIRTISDDSFEGLDLLFFAGEPEFTVRHWGLARNSGAAVIDLSGGLAAAPQVAPWIPALDEVLPPPAREQPGGRFYFSPSAGTIIACTLAAALKPFAVSRLAVILFQPVSERGQPGIQELEHQTVDLLSFKPITRNVYDAQVAFNLLSRYGLESREKLSRVRLAVAAEAKRYLAGRCPMPAIQVIQAPVFYCYAFTAYADFEAPPEISQIEAALTATGSVVEKEAEPAPDNINVAGESCIHFGPVEASAEARGFWFWGAADNVRLAAMNAVLIAEKLCAS